MFRINLHTFFLCIALGMLVGCDSTTKVSDNESTGREDSKVANELDQLRELALQGSGTQDGLDAGLELFAKSKGQAKNDAMGLLLENFYERMNYQAMTAAFLKEIPSPGIENWLQQMIAVGKQGNRARAILAYARYVDQIPEFRDGFEKNPQLLAKLPRLQREYLTAERTEEQRRELAALLQGLIADPIDGTVEGAPFADAAKKELYELENLAIGMVAPEIVGEDLDGFEFRLSDYRGKIVMLDFWGHWCPPCRRMYPQEQELVNRLASSPFVLLGVNSDRKLEVARDAVRDEGLVWRHFWNGPQGTSGNIAEQWNVIAWPTVYLIDGDGVIRYKDILGKDLDRAIEKLLAEQGHVVDLSMVH